MNTPTLKQFNEWIKDNKSLAETVCRAKAIAQGERERVDAYIKPIFESYSFVDEEGNKIATYREVFLSSDEAKCKEFFAACDAAHRAHGHTGDWGTCPALQAETLLIQAENALIASGCKLLGVKGFSAYSGENRAKMLDLLTSACMRAKEESHGKK
jgi:hypothetical protein